MAKGAKVIVIATDKGGDGKSTMSIQIAEHFAQTRNKKGLLIDLDPQGNSSQHFVRMEHDPFATKGGKKPTKHPEYNPNDPEQAGWDGITSTADIFLGRDIYPYPTKIANLSVIPAYASLLQDVEEVSKDDVTKKVYNRFLQFIQLIKNEYDFIVLDTRPSKGPLTSAAIKAASDLIIPTVLEQWSIDGIYGLLQMWKTEAFNRSDENPLNLVGILPNMVARTKLHSTFLTSLHNSNSIKDYIMPYVLRKRTIYAELMVDGGEPQSIYQLPENHPARIESEEVCNYIYDKVFK